MARELESRSLEDLKEGLATGRYRPREREAVREEIRRREQQEKEAAERSAAELAPANEALLRARLADRRSSLAVVISLLALAVAGLALLADPDAMELLREFFERGDEE